MVLFVTEDAGQFDPEAPLRTFVDLNIRIGLLRDLVLLRGFRSPEVDVKTLDLFDQHENCFSGCAQIVITTRRKARAPRAELVDLALVQTIAQRPSCLRRSVRRPLWPCPYWSRGRTPARGAQARLAVLVKWDDVTQATSGPA